MAVRLEALLPSGSRPVAQSTSLTTSLTNRDIHLWYLDRTSLSFLMPELANVLSLDEQQRRDRFKFQKDRDRFVLGRGLLRCILGHYLSCAPETIQFCYGDRGKPSVSKPRWSGIQFSVSYSSDRILYGFSRSAIGVDIEAIKPHASGDEILQRYFSSAIVEAIQGLPPERRGAEFLKVWTMMEAYLKGTGQGISSPFSTLDLSPNRRSPDWIVTPIPKTRWQTTHFTLGEYQAAIATRIHAPVIMPVYGFPPGSPPAHPRSNEGTIPSTKRGD